MLLGVKIFFVAVCIAGVVLGHPEGQRCSPLSNLGCPEGLQCLASNGGPPKCVGSSKQVLGENCFKSEECDDGLYCESPLAGGVGKCQKYLNEGDECDLEKGVNGNCNIGLQCLVSNVGPPKCVAPRKQVLGENCFQNEECDDELFCKLGVTFGPGQCTQYKLEGESCSPRDPNGFCKLGLQCLASNRGPPTCVGPRKQELGENCFQSEECDKDLFCKLGLTFGPGKCEQLRLEGESCNPEDPNGYCRTGLSCRASNAGGYQCVGQRKAGVDEDCFQDEECANGLWCKLGSDFGPGKCKYYFLEGSPCGPEHPNGYCAE